MARKAITLNTKIQVLTEAGYRCAVPTCRNILALDLHHIIEVGEGGGNEPHNLLALCALCHALYTRGEIKRESIMAWKTMLVALSGAFDREAVDNLLFLKRVEEKRLNGTQQFSVELALSGDGVLRFSRLIAAGLVDYSLRFSGFSQTLYDVHLTEKGERIIQAWVSGSREEVKSALSDIAK